MTRRKRDETLMAAGSGPANIWTPSEDRRNVRLAIPPVNLVGLAEPYIKSGNGSLARP
jgi:hypothetical protein